MITIIRAFVYYIMFIMYTYMYNLLAEYSYFAEAIFRHKFNVDEQFTEKNGYYNNFKYYYAHAYFTILKIVGTKIYLNNKILHERILWISNHRSKLDGIIVQSILCANGNDVVSVTKKSISYIPIFNSFGEHMKCIFIKRSKTEAEKIIMEESKNSLEKNRSILIFPEGTTLSPNTKLRSDKYATEKNLQPFKNVLIPKNTGYDIIRREGKFDRIGNITIRYAEPSIPEYSEHSFANLFRIFPRAVYIDIDYGDNISFNDLYKIFSEKEKKLEQPINKNDYHLIHNYSSICLILNLIIFIIFYYIFLYVPFFRYATLIYTLVMYIRTLLH